MKNRIKTGLGKTTHCVLLVGLSLLSTTAMATVISSQSNAYGLGVNLEIDIESVAVAQANATLPVLLQQTAPSAYDMSNTALSLATNITTTLSEIQDVSVFASAGVFSGQIISDTNGNAGNRTTSAYSEVSSLALSVTDTTFPLDLSALLEISSTTLNSYAEVSGDWNTFTATGSSMIEDLSIFFLGEQVDLIAEGISVDVLAGSTPNFQLIDFAGVAGLNLILNQQVSQCAMPGYCSMEVNALRFIFEGVSLLDAGIDGLINGEIIIGHSYADMSGIPASPVNAPAAIYMLVMATALSVIRAKR